MQEDKNVKKKGFLKGMKSELKKVIWPTGKQTVKSTFVTIAFVLLISLILIVLNVVFGKLSDLWISSLGGGDVINNTIVSGENVEQDDVVNNVVSGEVISGEILSGEEVSGE